MVNEGFTARALRFRSTQTSRTEKDVTKWAAETYPKIGEVKFLDAACVISVGQLLLLVASYNDNCLPKDHMFEPVG